MIRFSDATFAELKEIRAFLYVRMYRHWTVQRMRRKARRWCEELFATFAAAPELMPHELERLRRARRHRRGRGWSPTTSPA